MLIRATRGAAFVIGDGTGSTGVLIPGVIYVSWRLVRTWQLVEQTERIHPKSKFVFGEIVLSDLDIALTMFDLTPHGEQVLRPPFQLIVRYTEGTAKKTKRFLDIMTGVGPGGDSFGTLDTPVDEGQIQLQRITFMLRMPPADLVSQHILTEDG